MVESTLLLKSSDVNPPTINLDNSDTYLELAGDYYFTAQFSAGLSLEFAGDTDAFTIGARWYFR